VIALDRNWRESRKEEERLRKRQEQGPRQNQQEVFRQQIPQPQVWLRRQEAPQQQIPTGPVPMKGVERTNAVMVHPNQRAGFAQHNLYVIDIDQENRNCYSYRRFGHLARNCRNRGTRNRIGKRRRLEYRQNNGQRLMIEGENRQNNLNGDGDLIVLN